MSKENLENLGDESGTGDEGDLVTYFIQQGMDRALSESMGEKKHKRVKKVNLEDLKKEEKKLDKLNDLYLAGNRTDEVLMPLAKILSRVPLEGDLKEYQKIKFDKAYRELKNYPVSQ